MRVKKLKLKISLKKLVLSIVVVLFAFLIGFNFIKWFNDTKIDRILGTESYSYLPKEAKNFIKEVYEETGEIVLTEKNKKENMPYLSSKYVAYLGMNDLEKENVGYVPEVYSFDYVDDKVYEASLPSYFNLTNYNGSKYVSNTTNQGTLGVCWAITAVENVETLLMWRDKKPFNASSEVFSSRQFDYATSTNGMYYTKASSPSSKYAWSNTNSGYRELGKGGNFYLAAVAMSNGIVLTDSSVIPWSLSKEVLKPEAVFDLEKSEYEVLNTVQLPEIDSNTADQATINSFTSLVKNYINQYGGLFVGTLSPQSGCGFRNTDGTYAMKTDDCYAANIDYGHAMQVVGWDDNYTYTYCDNGTSHSSYDGVCSNKVTGKGAWILRNSWGDETDYRTVYLTYDSTRVSIGFVKEVQKMSERKWDNNYYTNPFGDGYMYYAPRQSLTLNTKMDFSEKIEQVKFHSFSPNASYKITLTTGGNNYTRTINTSEVGMYTVDVSDMNIIVNDSKVEYVVEGINGAYIVYGTPSIFTSNVSSEPAAKTVAANSTYESGMVVSNRNPLHILNNSAYMELIHFTKNIPAGAKLEYKLYKGDEEYTGYFFGSTTANRQPTVYSVSLDGKIHDNMLAGTTYWSDKELCGVTFTMKVLYNGKVVDEFPVKRSCNGKYTNSKLTFHSNDERNIKTTSFKEDLTFATLMNRDGTGNGSTGDGSLLFRPDKHIVGWKLSSDGTGPNYAIDGFYVYSDLDFYAEWADGHQYFVNYRCDTDECSYGSSITEERNYDESFTLPEITFTEITGSQFTHWDTSKGIYYPEESVKNLGNNDTPYNKDETAYVTARWSDYFSTVSFDANGGEGSMSSIRIDNTSGARLKYNLFTKENSSFKEWNTKKDGTGTGYSNGQVVKLNGDTTLYAQWKNTEYEVRFNSNGGSGTMSNQIFEHTVSERLDANTFSKTGYTFKEWNTKSDGSGTRYTGQQEVVDLTSKQETIVLYAIWEANTYIVSYDSNGGEGSMSSQTMTYDKEANLSSNLFTKEGYIFKEWNTKSDGTGTKYNNSQKVKNLISSGTVKLYAQWREKPSYEIDDYKVDDNNKMIEEISVSTTVEDFKKKVKVGTGYEVEIDSKTVEGKQVLYTGGKTKIYRDSELVVEYTNVVLGDVNGDAEINSGDLFRIRQHLLSLVTLKDEFSKAADVNKDTEINSGDLFRTRQHLLGIVKIG